MRTSRRMLLKMPSTDRLRSMLDLPKYCPVGTQALDAAVPVLLTGCAQGGLEEAARWLTKLGYPAVYQAVSTIQYWPDLCRIALFLT